MEPKDQTRMIIGKYIEQAINLDYNLKRDRSANLKLSAQMNNSLFHHCVLYEPTKGSNVGRKADLQLPSSID
jgi:hypothetical protein